MRHQGACICDRAVKVTTKGLKPVKPRGAAAVKPKGAPHPCTQLCTVKGRTRVACTSTVRGGVCPCPNC